MCEMVKVVLKVVNVGRKKLSGEKMNHGDAENTEKNKLCGLCGSVVKMNHTTSLQILYPQLLYRWQCLVMNFDGMFARQ